MRVAAIDIGTNSVLLLVAERRDGQLVAVEDRATVTRLGQGVDRTRSLHVDAIERTNACLSSYAETVRARGVDRVAVVGTSALRDASGSEQVTAFVQASFGAPLQVIAGQEEARLTFLGAVSGLAEAYGSLCAMDVGGGSTEFVQGRRTSDGDIQIDRTESFDVGSVRMTERFIKSDPPTPGELNSIRDALSEAFAGLPALAREPVPLGIAGTATTLAAISLELQTYDGSRVHGHVLPVREIERIVASLAAVPLAERRRTPGLHPGRADVIVGGGLVFLALMRQLGSQALRVSDRGLRWGVAEELASDRWDNDHNRA